MFKQKTLHRTEITQKKPEKYIHLIYIDKLDFPTQNPNTIHFSGRSQHNSPHFSYLKQPLPIPYITHMLVLVSYF